MPKYIIIYFLEVIAYMKFHFHHGCRRVFAVLLALLTVLSVLPGEGFAAQFTDYHDPAEHWLNSGSRTNELDINAVITRETFYCDTCEQNTSCTTWRVPEYTRDGLTALSRNICYSDGHMAYGDGTGTILSGVPGVNAFYTGYHWAKSMCDTCGIMNANRGPYSYAYGKNIYILSDCADVFFTKLHCLSRMPQQSQISLLVSA